LGGLVERGVSECVACSSGWNGVSVEGGVSRMLGGTGTWEDFGP
jgi:hypothetical protein